MIPHLKSLRKHTDVNTLVTVLCTACIVYVTLGNRQIGQQVSEAVASNTELMNVIAARDQKMFIDFMGRTLDHWEQRPSAEITPEPTPIPDKRHE